MVQIKHYCETCHEEKEEHYPELTYAPLSAVSLPEQTDKTEQQRQTVEDVVSFVFFQLVGQLALIAQTPVVKERNTCNPVAMFKFSVALKVVLTSRKVPHEVAPVHEIALIRQEETYVLKLCGHFDGCHFAATVIRNLCSFDASHPAFV